MNSELIQALAKELATKVNGVINIPLIDEEHEQAFFELLIVILLEILLNKLGRSLKLK
ncbi:MAG TPA: hypothetical protein PK802_04245 [Candidatus Cloacimonadota bacterium]|jgi:hypothetical protein|nr:hypothetical protein [Candidatus Cloacimonadota bacterium]HOR59264.1 hypothetical protein [Candidatus Cloacimonadota bacterium]HPB08885.1 hypothetical protein [Candidatus Cloacimonadota bacterium]HPL23771.1 hypothetical protein [Candidatus Cloacimonadota bacterium]HQL13536.1 hypothetical protein [Candidatus Cloacimonadota bacterium]